MKDAAEATGSPASLHEALLDYFSAPGKYQLTLRQPALLFASVREILQIAAGRGASADLPEAAAAKLAEAANFFLHAALLYPGADHYAVLGLPPRTAPVELKERYRLLMRLIHPDFTPMGSSAWPADAAVRVNRAYEVLSSPVLRKEYDEQLASPHGQRAAETGALKAHRTPARGRREGRTWDVNPKAAWALGTGLAVLVIMLLMPSGESVDLVQKLPVPLSGPQPRAEPTPGAAPPTTTAVAQAEPLAAGPGSPPAAVPLTASPALGSSAPVLAWKSQVEATASARATAPAPAPAPMAALRREMPMPPAAQVTRVPPMVVQPAPRAPDAGVAALAVSRPLDEMPNSAAAPAVTQPAPPAAPVPVTSVQSPPLRAVPAPVPVPAAPSLADAQPLLSQLLQLLESGNGNQLLRLLEVDSRRSASAQALSYQYDQLVRGARPVRLTQVEFKGENREGVLLVTGRIRLHAGEPTIGSHGERFVVRAEFVAREGRVLLTGLSGAAD